jgi:hypothetical protein
VKVHAVVPAVLLCELCCSKVAQLARVGGSTTVAPGGRAQDAASVAEIAELLLHRAGLVSRRAVGLSIGLLGFLSVVGVNLLLASLHGAPPNSGRGVVAALSSSITATRDGSIAWVMAEKAPEDKWEGTDIPTCAAFVTTRKVGQRGDFLANFSCGPPQVPSTTTVALGARPTALSFLDELCAKVAGHVPWYAPRRSAHLRTNLRALLPATGGE